MSGETSRRALLGALAAAPVVAALPAVTSAAPVVDRTAWDRRLHEFRLRQALREADTKFGAYREAMRRYDDEQSALVAEFGSWSRARAQAADRCDAAFAITTEADDVLLRALTEPLDAAILALVMTPAPDLDAAIFKIGVISDYDVDSWCDMPRDPMAIVHEDMRRLAMWEG